MSKLHTSVGTKKIVKLTPIFYDLSNYKVDMIDIHSKNGYLSIGSQFFMFLYKAKRNVTSLHTVQCSEAIHIIPFCR